MELINAIADHWERLFGLVAFVLIIYILSGLRTP